MSDEQTLAEHKAQVEIEPCQERSGTLKGGHDPVEMGRRSGEVRRERKAEREAAAELDKLSVLARAGVVAARVLTYETQCKILDAMIKKAQQGHVQAARFVLDWLVKLGPSDPGDEDVDNVLDPADMTPAQRAAVRAVLLRKIAEQSGESDEFAGAA